MSVLDNLRKEAKRWLKEVRKGNPGPRKRLRLAYPNAPPSPSLRDVQHALARERGYESWIALTRAVREASERAEPAFDPDRDLAATFLQFACWDHHTNGPAADVRHQHDALRLLSHHPEIARDSFYTAVVCGDRERVERLLDERPALANEKGGPRGWEPLLYLCYTRLAIEAVGENAVAIARTLLDRGANPNAYYMAGDALYSTLVGVAGEGEQDVVRHPQAAPLFELLLERGAEMYDIQVLYNTSFHGDVLWWLEMVHARAVELGRKSDWDDSEWPMFDMGPYGSGARYLLQIALDKNDLKLADWLLSHGANPNAPQPRDPRLPQRSLYEEAVRRGYTGLADLLLRYGATRTPVALNDEDAFAQACFALDRDTATAILAKHSEYGASPQTIRVAAERDRADVVALLLDLGVPPDVEDSRKTRPLHVAARHDAVDVIALLVDRGAEIDPRELNWGNTPLMTAVYHQQRRAIELLSRVSKDVWNLAGTGNVERLRAVLREDPALAKSNHPQDLTPLFWLPDAEQRAVVVVELLLADGADPSVASKDGWTAARLARRRGLDEAADRIEAAAGRSAGPRLNAYESLADDITLAFDTGDAVALQRINDHYKRRLTADDLRATIWQRVRTVREAKGRHGSFPVSDAREMVAREEGFANWNAFAQAIASGTPPPGHAYVIDAKANTVTPRRALMNQDWDALMAVVKERRLTGLDVPGQMTDDALDRASRLDHVTRLNVSGSRAVTDVGLRHLARMPQLEELVVTGTSITDRGLEVLSHLPNLKTFHMSWQRGVSDRGIAHLSSCEALESVDLMGTETGDGAIEALAGKRGLRRFKTGRLVTDRGLPLLHQFPMFETWQSDEISYSLMSPEAGPTFLLLDGSFTNAGVDALSGLDGLFGLTFFWHVTALTSEGLGALANLVNLGMLGCQGKLCDDVAMRHIAALPRLRMLMAQGTVATDEGFVALGRSRTIEHIWGRECPNLAGRGFSALSKMPALRGLAVSCANVDDGSLAALPRFPALTALMPMDVHDEGFRYVGRALNLEELWCMYCRETTDAATEHIGGLSRLKKYYAGATQITDRSLEMLGRMTSLERIEFYETQHVTDAGLAFLARLPNLREVHIAGLPNVTLAGLAVFPAHVRVNHSLMS